MKIRESKYPKEFIKTFIFLVETSQEELLRKLKEFNKKQKEKGYDIKEKIRQRKSHQSKQSQAQKWAINRKKVEK